MMSGQLLLLFGVFLGAMALRLPVFLAAALSTIVYSQVYSVMSPIVLVQSLNRGLSQSAFAAIPLYFLAGAIMNAGGITRRLLRLAHALLAPFRGGLAHVNIGASMLFGGVSGSAVADVSAIGSVMIPAMKEDGYPGAYAAAVTASSATIGLLIPPSIPMVMFGLFNNASIGDLFIAGIVPGLLMGVYLLAVSAWIARRRGFAAHGWLGWRELSLAARGSALALLLPAIIIGSLVGGLATATEVGAIACVYAALISTLVYRDLGWRELCGAVIESAIDSARILSIVAISGGVLWIVANSGATDGLGDALARLALSPGAMLSLIAVGLLLVGTVVGPGLQMILIIPVLTPVVLGNGVDILHFGVIAVLSTALGLLTPPVGILLFLTAAQARVRVGEVVVELIPFLVALILLLVLIVWCPWLATGLGKLLS